MKEVNPEQDILTYN